MKLPRSLLPACLGTLALVGAGIAADYPSYTIDLESNDSRGQFLYRRNCRSACHDGEHGDGPALSPMDKMMEEWETIAADVGGIPCLAKWPEGLSEEDLSDIFSYLYNGASDSPSPVS